ncbi:MAG: hypothetical protein HFF00_00490 [Ruminiclostridium sp.]|jgi:hypothetical protein|nr:hypothetical protein [Ruminiclostridium sp.]
MYNAYIPGGQPYEMIPEEPPPGPAPAPGPSRTEKPTEGLMGLWKKLGLSKLESGDLLLLLILFLLLREGDKFDPILLMALAAIFLLPDSGAAVEDPPVG